MIYNLHQVTQTRNFIFKNNQKLFFHEKIIKIKISSKKDVKSELSVTFCLFFIFIFPLIKRVRL